MKRTIPLIIASTVGVTLAVAYYIPPAEEWGNKVVIDWFNILSAIAFILGGANLLKMHLRKISDRQRGWGFSAVILVSFITVLVGGLLKLGVQPPADYVNYPWAGKYDDPDGFLGWYIKYMYTPLASTMFSLLAFFIASAVFRAFRAKNVEAALLLGTAFIVLLGRTYAGIFLTEWLDPYAPSLRLDRITEYIMNVPNTAGTRAITIGIALGIVSTSLKVLLGMDRSYLGSD